MFNSGLHGFGTHFAQKEQQQRSAQTPGGTLPLMIMGSVQSNRCFATSAAHRNNFHQHPQQTTKMGIARNCLTDEGTAKVINRDNNYPNNARKTSEDMSLNHIEYQPEGGGGGGSMEGAIIIAASAGSPLNHAVEVGTSLTIISSLRRRVSECPSEDSYIVFEGCDSELDDLESIFDEDDVSSEEEESGDDWDGDERQETKEEKTEVADESKQNQPKKVHFPPDEQLAEVHRMIMWSFAYRACRKGPWEQCVRDRARFLRRIDCCREQLCRILQPNHREKIYAERFQHRDHYQQIQQSQICGSDAINSRKKHPKRHKKRRNGKKRRKNRHKPRR